jgi:hypothetical protein
MEIEKLKFDLDLASAFGKPNPLAKFQIAPWSRGRGVDFSHWVSLAEY